MFYKLKFKKKRKKKLKIKITGSKSESNRLLIIKKLYKKIKLFNISNSNDTKLMLKALNNKKKKTKINIKDAGTVLRFLISYFTIKKNYDIILTGTKRMKKRPIYYLVKALKSIGGNIKYLKKIGYPPIRIKGKKIIKKNIFINSNISSQYITSLILIGPFLKKGLIIKLLKEKISLSYIKMTIKIFKKLNFNIKIKKNYIIIKKNKEKNKKKFFIESDWSSISYFYSILSILDDNKKIFFSYFKKKSLQGDSIIRKIYKKFFGIKTIFYKKKKILIYKKKNFKFKKKFLKINLKSTPDIAQTLILTCSILKIKCLLTGLNSLKIKETNRLKALKKELFKIGIETKITDESIEIINFFKNKKKNIFIKTYKDHRMAMAFSVVAIKKKIFIENPKTVKKSYPNFWKDIKKIGFILKKY
ncbi:MAG: 3-phosphoshikimate 1-carboxyvinyltransferase [Candidatus Shikimatogenerans sp. JK-2022]|nr:3-phosphoshikimate 1-carboxyvinyltransferase [Candidatus Shikimatogenerans bostrichidophilus]